MPRGIAARWTFAHENLRNCILTSELAPGATLTESLVARDLEVSPTPFRTRWAGCVRTVSSKSSMAGATESHHSPWPTSPTSPTSPTCDSLWKAVRSGWHVSESSLIA